MTLFKPASRLAAVSVSPILALSAKAAALRSGGLDVIDLTIGEPDFETPERIKHAALLAMAGGKTRYTPIAGGAELREAIVRRMGTRHGIEMVPAQAIACAGAKQVIHNALAATLEPGHEVVLLQPFWTSYADMISLEGGLPVVASGRWDDRRGWRIDLDAIERAISPATRWLVLNNPGNPGGSVLDEAERAAIAELLSRHPQVWLLADDIYEDIAFDGLQRTLAADYPALAPRTLIVGGVSKAYAMTGWRLGWGVGPAALIQAMSAIQSQTTSAPSSISQAAAVEALNGPQNMPETMRLAFKARNDQIAPRLARLAGWLCPPAQGAFYLFPKVDGLIGARSEEGALIDSDSALCAYLLEKAQVALAPGSVFGAPGHLRLSFAASLDRLHQACDRIEAAVAALGR